MPVNPSNQISPERPIDRLVNRTLSILGKEYAIIGKTHIRAWQAWLAIGLATGVFAGVVLVANRSGEVEKGRAASFLTDRNTTLSDVIIVDLDEFKDFREGRLHSFSDFIAARRINSSIRREERDYISSAVRTKMSQVREEDRDKIDFLVVHRYQGNIITPEFDREKNSIAEPSNNLTFTFDSPDEPWTTEEINQMQLWINDLYPTVKEIYGPPAFANMVNVRKDSSLSYAGMYGSGSNEIILNGNLLSSGRVDVLIHEMLHAFRDDLVNIITAFEEGMVRAAEIEVFNQAESYNHPWDDHHSYYWDVFYDLLNVPDIAPATTYGSFWDGFPNGLMRYQLAGYAWWKLVAEDPTFFQKFNAAYFSGMAVDETLRLDREKLWQIVFSVKIQGEGAPIAEWRNRQYIFSESAPVGTRILLCPISHGCGYLFDRDDQGYVTVRPDQTVRYVVADTQGDTLYEATLTTNQLGVFFGFPSGSLPSNFTGALTIRAVNETLGVAGSLIDRWPNLMFFYLEVDGHTTTSILGGATSIPSVLKVSIQSTSVPSLYEVVQVENGAFRSYLIFGRGNYQIIFSDARDRIFTSRGVTKDETWYALADIDVAFPDLAIPSAGVVKQPIGYKYSVVVSNQGRTESGEFGFKVESGLFSRKKTLASLKPGESIVVTGRILRLPVTFTVDPQDLIQELNEGNNTLTISQPTPPPTDTSGLRQVEGPSE